MSERQMNILIRSAQDLTEAARLLAVARNELGPPRRALVVNAREKATGALQRLKEITHPKGKSVTVGLDSLKMRGFDPDLGPGPTESQVS